MEHRKQKSDLNKFLFLLFTLTATTANGMKKVPEYQHHRIEDLCKASNQQKVELALNNKPTVLTLNSSVLLAIRCHLELELHSDQFGFSVFTEQMNFELTKGCTRDYYQFGRDFLVFTSHKGPKRCGKWDPARRVLREDGSLLRLDYGKTPRSRREYIEDVDKEMDLWLVVHPTRKGQPHKQLKLVITPFKKHCTPNDHYYRRCPSTKQPQCIRRELFCDGQINCGGHEKDEQMEYCIAHLGTGVDMFMTIPIIILIVVFSIVGLMFLLFLIKMFATHLKPKRRAERRVDRVSGHRQVEQTMSLCPPAATAAAQEGRGLRALQAQLSSSPAASQPSAPLSPLSSEDPLSQPGLPSHPPSYSEAVSTPSTPLYPCAPPKYSELPEGGSTAVIR